MNRRFIVESPDLPAAESLPELRARLREAEETLNAIRNGEVDAVVVGGPGGQQVYTLENADRPYRVLIEQMQEGAITLSESGTVLYCNQRFATLVETPRESIIGHDFSLFFDVSERAAIQDLVFRSVFGTGAEFTLYAAGGTGVPVNVSLVDLRVDDGVPRVICGVVTDLTQNRRRSLELAAANTLLAQEIDERRRAEDSLSVALAAAGMGSWDLDLVTDTARRSARYDEIFGYERPVESFGLRTVLRHFVAEDRVAVAKAFADAESGGAIDIESRITRADDQAVRWVHLKGRTYYEEGRPVRIAGVISDITDSKMVEEQLRQAQKMEAVGQLTGGIAHDFNNLLMIIGGSLDLLNRLAGSDDKIASLVNAARQGVDRGARLNHQLLAFSRRQDLDTQAICINDLIPDFEHLLDRAVGETVKVEVEKAEDLWYCSTDPHQLETAIVNLAINARDAMPNGGTLALVTENRSVNLQSAITAGAAPGDYAVVSVADTGTGMTPEIAARVFEPFFTTKDIGKGTGLGLSQVYGFARQSGGFVTVETALGHGAKFLIHLPRTEPVEPTAASAHAVAPNTDGQGTILVVEDDVIVRATAAALLEDLGYRIVEAETVSGALDIIEGGAPLVLVLTDIIMPGGKNGIDLATEIAQRRPDLPVLLTSGYTAQHLIPEHSGGAWSLLRKPYSQGELSRAVNDVIGRVKSPASIRD